MNEFYIGFPLIILVFALALYVGLQGKLFLSLKKKFHGAHDNQEHKHP